MGANIIKRNETGKLSRDYFLTYYHFSGKWSNLPYCLSSHIKVFFAKKSQSLILSVNLLLISLTHKVLQEMRLFSLFYKKYHRSIIIFIEVS